MDPAERPGDFASFRSVESLTSTIWTFLLPAPESDSPLIAGATEGLYRIDHVGGERRVTLAWDEETAYSLLRDPADPTTL